MLLVGWIWIWMTLPVGLGEDDFEDETLGYDDTEVTVRYVERSLILLEAGEGRSAALKWVIGADEMEEELEDLEFLLDGVESGPEVVALERALAALRGEGGPGTGVSEEAKTSLLYRFLWTEAPWYLGLFAAFPALWMVRRDWRDRGKLWRVMGAWHPASVVAIFFITSLLGDFLIYDLTYDAINLAAGEDLGWLLTSFLWRGCAAILAAFILIGSWSAMRRIFWGSEPVRWKAVAGVFAVLSLFEVVRYQLGAVDGVVDPTDFFLVADPTPLEAFFEFADATIFAPVFEELMFRGVLFLGLVKRMGALPAAVLSSLLFSVVHTQYEFAELISVGVFGLGCCWLTWRTGSIKSSVVLHVIYNGLITGSTYWFYQVGL